MRRVKLVAMDLKEREQERREQELRRELQGSMDEEQWLGMLLMRRYYKAIGGEKDCIKDQQEGAH